MEDLVKLEQMLKAHDWFYFMSDDPSVFRSGSNQVAALKEQIQICCDKGYEDEADQLYEKYKKTLS